MLLLLLLLLMPLLLLLQSCLLHLQQAVVPAFKLFFLVVKTTGMGLESHFLKVASHHRRKRKLPCEPALFPCRRLIWSDYDKHKDTCTIPLFHKTEIERRDPQAFHPPIEKNEIWLLFCFLSIFCLRLMTEYYLLHVEKFLDTLHHSCIHYKHKIRQIRATSLGCTIFFFWHLSFTIVLELNDRRHSCILWSSC